MSPNEEAQPTKEVFFTHEFKRNMRQLAKKYRRIQQDIQPILDIIGISPRRLPVFGTRDAAPPSAGYASHTQSA